MIETQSLQAEGLCHSSRGQHTRVRPRNRIVKKSSRPVRTLQFYLVPFVSLRFCMRHSITPILQKPLETFRSLQKAKIKNPFSLCCLRLPLLKCLVLIRTIRVKGIKVLPGQGQSNPAQASPTWSRVLEEKRIVYFLCALCVSVATNSPIFHFDFRTLLNPNVTYRTLQNAPPGGGKGIFRKTSTRTPPRFLLAF